MSYVPVRVSTLRGDQKTNFDLYVRVAEKHILYVRSGSSFEGERLQRLKKKKLKKMFIDETSEGAYRSYMTENISMALDKSSGKSLTDRSEIVQGAQQASSEELMENPDNPMAYTAAKEGASQFVNFLLTENEALKSMLDMDMTDENSVAQHSVAVATTSVALATRLGWKNEQEMNLLVLGALVHDLGLAEIGWDFTLNPADIDQQQRIEYERHPQAGANMVKSMRHFETTVINIIMEHEEMIDGSGFPQKLNEKRMDPASIVVGTCDAMDQIARYERIRPIDATKKLLINMVGRYPLNYIQELQKVVANPTL